MSKQQWGHGYHTGRKEAKKAGKFPVGYCFHETDSEGKIQKQGYVHSKLGKTLYLCYLDWWEGAPIPGLVPRDINNLENLVFYQTPYLMRRAHAVEAGLSEDDFKQQERYIKLMGGQ